MLRACIKGKQSIKQSSQSTSGILALKSYYQFFLPSLGSSPACDIHTLLIPTYQSWRRPYISVNHTRYTEVKTGSEHLYIQHGKQASYWTLFITTTANAFTTTPLSRGLPTYDGVEIPPAISLLYLLSDPKVRRQSDELRLQEILTRATTYIDPVLVSFDNGWDDLNTKGFELVQFATGRTSKFYTPHGAWIHDNNEKDDQTILDDGNI
ncbi:hypothetical protein PHISCL_09017 [Aspergillus sclerotialis]|uniref:Uncharacterized protein n=1 Tax=Aspergillus sclerotialis TaxID=2070753 RepID=A0A3A2ZBH9_9EURO|nr:hypothetical protein PHISCL_09017 [Aspergillus sclerotialis]